MSVKTFLTEVPKSALRMSKRAARSGTGKLLTAIDAMVRSITGTLADEAYLDLALMVDVSKYQDNIDPKVMADIGIDIVCLRIGGPTQFVEGNSPNAVDPNYYRFFDLLMREPRLMRWGYWVLNHESMRETPDSAVPDEQLNDLQSYTNGGYMPQVLSLDVEINWYMRGTTKITVPQGNYTKSVMGTMNGMWNRFKKPVVLYSRRTFLDEACGKDIMYRLDEANAGYDPQTQTGAERFPLWYAWYVLNSVALPEPADVIKAKLPKINPATKYYLSCGSHSDWFAWQVGTVKHAGACYNYARQAHAMDFNILRWKPEKVWDYLGYKYPGTTDPGGGGTPGTGDPVPVTFEQRLKVAEDRLDAQAAEIIGIQSTFGKISEAAARKTGLRE